MVDVLSDILSVLRLRGTLYFRTEFTPPWGLRVPPFAQVARFHLLVRGEGVVRVDDVEEPIRMTAGDLIVIPRGAGHSLADSEATPCKSVDNIVAETGFRGDGALVVGGAPTRESTSFVCGHFTFDDFGGVLLLETLPRFILLRGFEETEREWVETAMRYISAKADDRSPGAEAIISRLSEILFVEAVRRHAAKKTSGLLAAIRDPQIGRALAAMHKEPQRDWSVEALAAEAGLSRTVFAERAREQLEQPPMQYLTRWRMELAAHRLSSSTESLTRVAASVGYASTGAFIRVFKKHFGVRPGDLRRNLDKPRPTQP